jgi:hypothetical protein
MGWARSGGHKGAIWVEYERHCMPKVPGRRIAILSSTSTFPQFPTHTFVPSHDNTTTLMTTTAAPTPIRRRQTHPRPRCIQCHLHPRARHARRHGNMEHRARPVRIGHVPREAILIGSAQLVNRAPPPGSPARCKTYCPWPPPVYGCDDPPYATTLTGREIGCSNLSVYVPAPRYVTGMVMRPALLQTKVRRFATTPGMGIAMVLGWVREGRGWVV